MATITELQEARVALHDLMTGKRAAPVHCRTAGDTNVFLLAGGGADTGSYPGTPGQVFLLGGPIQLEPLGVDWCRTYGD